jgi:hypothetical protein
LGTAACRELLRRGWHVWAFDRQPLPAGESIVADLCDQQALAEALRGAAGMVPAGSGSCGSEAVR